MSEPEFEAYLRQLALSLGLNAGQKESVAAELRDHLEERLEQLTRAGVARDDACRQALAEFGDAVVLAHDFTLPHHRRQRRQAVRYTLSSVAIVVTTFVMASFYWPVQRPEPFGQIVAQSEPAKVDAPVNLDESDTLRANIEAKLQSRDIVLNFVDTPFSDALMFVSDALDVDVVVDKAFFEDEGMDLSAPINLKLRQGNVSVKTALRLLLRQMNMEESGAVVIRDGYIDITRSEKSHEVQVYNCRDLLEGVQVDLGGAGGNRQAQAGGGGFFQIAPELLTASLGQFQGGGMGGGLGGGPLPNLPTGVTSHAGAVLINVIQQATQALWQDIDGEGGTITEFNGLITIGHTQQVHERVADVLKKLRAANGKNVVHE